MVRQIHATRDFNIATSVATKKTASLAHEDRVTRGGTDGERMRNQTYVTLISPR